MNRTPDRLGSDIHCISGSIDGRSFLLVLVLVSRAGVCLWRDGHQCATAISTAESGSPIGRGSTGPQRPVLGGRSHF